ncbi:large conductance mechanosensitive channel protein MscL [Paenibacillus guangzhouensis]|uniref:large conductance mechanosensitive channel protein MscL n=1 Tax=Paenibacillus guangzhouensis TaxID=1473112 RepID=UPI001266F64E|nr:large conductance mechanosensitive channel protein MscL [Paenibacillus guangzhouensis]
MKIMKEFREFAVRGNVIDLAVGVIIGGAFGKIVTSVVNDVVMPPIGRLLGAVDFKDLYIPLADGTNGRTLAQVKAENIPVIAYGQFINVIIEFLIIAFCVFMLVKGINMLKREQKKEEVAAEPTTKDCPYCYSSIPVQATRCGHCTSQLTKTEPSTGV